MGGIFSQVETFKKISILVCLMADFYGSLFCLKDNYDFLSQYFF